MPTPPRKDEEAALSASDIVLVAFDGVEAIDVAGPASVFTKAEQMRPGSYRLHIASPAGGTVSTNGGLSFAGTCTLQQLPVAIDTLIVAGGDEPGVRAAIVEQRIGAWLAQTAPQARRIASVCTGAFALAAAGLLDGREATTHWRACDQLQALRPQVRVRHERIYVHDGQCGPRPASPPASSSRSRWPRTTWAMRWRWRSPARWRCRCCAAGASRS